MATLENGTSNAKSSRRGISFEFQSKDLPSKRLLGKGLSGIGYETAWKGARYARKDFVGVHRDIFLQEATVLVGLKDHKNIVKTYGWTVDKRSCSLVLEYMDEDLLSLLQKRMDSKRGVVGKESSTSTSTQPVDLPEAVDMMLQIAAGVECLHEQGHAHGDLKTKNILVTRRKDGDQSSTVLKLSDFGLEGTKRKSRYIVSRRVRKLDMARWKSPECLEIFSRRLNSSNGDEDETSSESESESAPSSVPEVSSACAGTKSSDVYSFSLICSQILTGHSPYPYLDWKELMFKILSGFRPVLPVSLHPLLRELLMSCWGDPAERPSFSSIRMKLKRVQGLLTAAIGKRPQEAAAPSLADSPAHQAAVVPSTEVSRSFSNCLSLKPSVGPAIVPSEWTAPVATLRSNTPGVPSAASSAPSPSATAAASPAVDESYEPTQSEDLPKDLEGAWLRDLMTTFDPSTNRFRDQSFDQLVSASSDLINDPTLGRGSNLAGTSFLGRSFIEKEVVHLYSVVQTGIMDRGNVKLYLGTPSSASLLQTFKPWTRTSILPPSQRKREKSKNQCLLRRCLKIPTSQRDLQQKIQTHGAVSQSTVSQGPPLQRDLVQGIQTHGADSQSTASPGLPLVSSCKVDILSDMDVEPFPLFMANLSPVPVTSKDDKALILGDDITYLTDLQTEIDELDASKCQAEHQYEERQCEDLKLSHQDLKQRNRQLEAGKSPVERQCEDLKLSHQDLKQRNRQLEAGKSAVECQYEDLKLPHQDREQRNRQLETGNGPVDRYQFHSFMDEIFMKRQGY